MLRITLNEVDYFLRDSRPLIAIIRPADRTVLEPLAERAGIPHVETLGADGEGSFLESAAQATCKLRIVAEQREFASGDCLYLRYDRAIQRDDADARQSRVQCRSARRDLALYGS